jgi:hypothetical protein
MPRLRDRLPHRSDPYAAVEPGPTPTVARRRRALAALVVVVVVVVVVVLVTSGGQAATPPATGAAAVVPAGALEYIHVSTDQSRPAVTSALALAGRFPGYAGLRSRLLSGLGALGPTLAADFKTRIEPWLGKEVALAVFDTSTTSAGSLLVVGVSHLRPAQRYVAGLPADGTTSYQGTTITGHPGAGDTAFVGRYLVIGHSADIRAAVDVAAGRAPSLSHDPSYRRAAAGEPAGRAVDAYLSGPGLRRLIIPQHGLLGIIGALVDQPTLQGVAVSLTPAAGGVQVHVHSVLDPQLAGASAASFVPSFASSVPAGVGLFLDVTGLNRILPRVLSTIGIGAQIPKLLTKLGHALTAEGVDVQQSIVSLFQRESAVVISTHGVTPVVTVIVRPRDLAATRTVFAELEAPLERLFAPAGAQAGQAPVFNQVAVGGVAAHQLVLAPGLQFDYAVIGNELVLSTSLQGIAGVALHASSILGEPAYRTTLGNHPSRVTSLLFLDLNQLLRLNDQIGLITGSGFSALKPDLGRVRAIGLDSTSGEADSTSELFLQIP